MTKHQTCPRCGALMNRIYEHATDPLTHKRVWCAVGWLCPDPFCKNIMQD